MTKSALANHIKSVLILSEEELSEILSYFDFHKLTKKETLLSAGKLCNRLFFVEKGCLQLYFIDDLGNHKTTQFAMEHWWLTDFLAFQNQKPSNFYVETVEKSKVLSISFSKHQELLDKCPKMEKYYRNIYETAYGAALMRLKYMNSLSKEEMFFMFRDNFPEFVQRVPQYLLASFLGLTPEYLSEIKKKQLS
ncbi:Crp/Fnr family transcriptional regulator [Flagellimonas pacifica]|uniref:cAMP-binding domain of CRP or a regulatory subunit of cAMP-dependent protein kinases n=1 Tax=Flagellimonas pacifica TaxID=1247520 RepID=A0A285MTU3_9FLAO|nr:Crp/Fnr family transcriptional regulator [Allomuricauda parva]SNZ00592.1 cAMP-binding domain of CRP or a regulatory subunit of cAMP-dependent protein kinases [Allomuricauda parva]